MMGIKSVNSAKASGCDKDVPLGGLQICLQMPYVGATPVLTRMQRRNVVLVTNMSPDCVFLNGGCYDDARNSPLDCLGSKQLLVTSRSKRSRGQCESFLPLQINVVLPTVVFI
jgi:hypothetical protein